MGFSIVAIRPESITHFTCTIWGWRPIWFYVVTVYPQCVGLRLTIPETGYPYRLDEAGWTNDGLMVPGEHAVAIGNAMLESINATKDSNPEKIAKALKNMLEHDKIMDAIKQGYGPGYYVDTQTLKEFAEFAIQSGGFSIW